MKNLVIIILATIFIFSCKYEDALTPEPYTPTPYFLATPQDFPDMKFEEDNPLTEEGIALGEKLYFDNILSTNGNSCSSCHYQEFAYSSPSIGPTGNNIMPHFNLGWKKHFGWAGGEKVLELVDLGDLEDGNPFLNIAGVMGQNDSILSRFKKHPVYKEMFRKAFNVDIVNVDIDTRKKHISNALAQFMRTLVSANSKYDKYLRNELQLTTSQLNGFVIFNTEKGDCFHCHSTAMFTDHLFHNNGISSDFLGVDKGRYLVTNNTEDMGKFYTPSLRNIEFTSPYMHDGRFETLEEVIEHYNSGGHYSTTIDPLMKKVGIGLQLTEQEKQDLIAFLITLSDTEFLTN
ncbi:MAG: cytochrome-c peroxidase [Flavobacteriales bacterium]|nr:cytochrome-c peroxidase [Flavobacteriales bacterium]